MDAAVYLRALTAASQMLRLKRQRDALPLDFCIRIHGIRSYESLRSRATPDTFGNSQRLAAGRPQDLAILVTLEEVNAKIQARQKAKPVSLKKQFESMRNAMIDAWLALPPERRTNFLRKRIGIASSAL